MKICIIDSAAPENLQDEAATYVAELGPALAEEQRIRIVTVRPGFIELFQTAVRLRRAVAVDATEIVHFNNLAGLSLATSIYAVRSVALPPALAIGLHDDLLLRRLPGLNRVVTRAIGLVVSPSLTLLDQHRVAGFFPDAHCEVIPYAMPYHTSHLVGAYRRLLIQRRSGDLGNRVA